MLSNYCVESWGGEGDIKKKKRKVDWIEGTEEGKGKTFFCKECGFSWLHFFFKIWTFRSFPHLLDQVWIGFLKSFCVIIIFLTYPTGEEPHTRIYTQIKIYEIFYADVLSFVVLNIHTGICMCINICIDEHFYRRNSIFGVSSEIILSMVNGHISAHWSLSFQVLNRVCDNFTGFACGFSSSPQTILTVTGLHSHQLWLFFRLFSENILYIITKECFMLVFPKRFRQQIWYLLLGGNMIN